MTEAGTATVSGTVVCDYPVSAFVTAGLEQRFARATAQAENSAVVACSTEPTRWTVELTSGNGIRFGGGRAHLSATASASGDLGTTTVTSDSTVPLRRQR